MSNNLSGDNDHRVSFEAINRPTITEVLNYPNPFTTSTRFCLHHQGREPPTHMKVRLTTVTGRGAGGYHAGDRYRKVGRNISEFAGRNDEFETACPAASICTGRSLLQ